MTRILEGGGCYSMCLTRRSQSSMLVCFNSKPRTQYTQTHIAHQLYGHLFQVDCSEHLEEHVSNMRQVSDCDEDKIRINAAGQRQHDTYTHTFFFHTHTHVH